MSAQVAVLLSAEGVPTGFPVVKTGCAAFLSSDAPLLLSISAGGGKRRGAQPASTPLHISISRVSAVHLLSLNCRPVDDEDVCTAGARRLECEEVSKAGCPAPLPSSLASAEGAAPRSRAPCGIASCGPVQLTAECTPELASLAGRQLSSAQCCQPGRLNRGDALLSAGCSAPLSADARPLFLSLCLAAGGKRHALSRRWLRSTFCPCVVGDLALSGSCLPVVEALRTAEFDEGGM